MADQIDSSLLVEDYSKVVTDQHTSKTEAPQAQPQEQAAHNTTASGELLIGACPIAIEFCNSILQT